MWTTKASSSCLLKVAKLAPVPGLLLHSIASLGLTGTEEAPVIFDAVDGVRSVDFAGLSAELAKVVVFVGEQKGEWMGLDMIPEYSRF